MSAAPIERGIRFSGLLIAAGLFVQIITLCWTHPLAFMSFILIGCPLVAAGILFFLYSLVTHHDGKPI
jgi:hypothetical protein